MKETCSPAVPVSPPCGAGSAIRPPVPTVTGGTASGFAAPGTKTLILSRPAPSVAVLGPAVCIPPPLQGLQSDGPCVTHAVLPVDRSISLSMGRPHPGRLPGPASSIPARPCHDGQLLPTAWDHPLDRGDPRSCRYCGQCPCCGMSIRLVQAADAGVMCEAARRLMTALMTLHRDATASGVLAGFAEGAIAERKRAATD